MTRSHGDRTEAVRQQLGAEIRRLRTAAGLTQASLADRAGYSRVYVTLVETGRDSPGEDFIRRLSSILDSGEGLLTLYGELSSQRTAQREQSPAAVTDRLAHELEFQAPSGPSDELVSIPVQASDGRFVFVNVSRRTILRGIAAVALNGTISAASPLASASTAAAASDIAPIEHFREMRKVMIDSDNLFGPTQVIPTVYEQIQILQRLRQTIRGTDGKTLLHMQTQFAEFAAWLHQDQGDHDTARYWTDRALEWSHTAQDPELTTFILARKSQLAGDMRDAMTAIDVADAAARMAPPGTRLAAVASTYAAHGHALAGDRTASARAYDQAHEMLASTEVDPQSSWGVWLDASYIEVQRAASLVVLGNYATAAEGFERAIAELPDGYPRDRGVYLARAALAHARRRDPEQAAALGMQALAIGAATKSGRITTQLREVDHSLGDSNTSAVNEFRDALRSVCRAA